MEAVFGALGIILVAVITGLVTWLTSKRAKSGKIDTSEAAKLWDEGTEMRRELRAEIVALKFQLGEAIQAVADLNVEIQKSRAETEDARKDTKILIDHLNQLHEEIQTSNELSIGQLADNAEIRRIMGIRPEDRTRIEKRHLATANDRQPRSDRPPVPSDREEGHE